MNRAVHVVLKCFIYLHLSFWQMLRSKLLHDLEIKHQRFLYPRVLSLSPLSLPPLGWSPPWRNFRDACAELSVPVPRLSRLQEFLKILADVSRLLSRMRALWRERQLWRRRSRRQDLLRYRQWRAQTSIPVMMSRKRGICQCAFLTLANQ